MQHKPKLTPLPCPFVAAILSLRQMTHLEKVMLGVRFTVTTGHALLSHQCGTVRSKQMIEEVGHTSMQPSADGTNVG